MNVPLIYSPHTFLLNAFYSAFLLLKRKGKEKKNSLGTHFNKKSEENTSQQNHFFFLEDKMWSLHLKMMQNKLWLDFYKSATKMMKLLTVAFQRRNINACISDLTRKKSIIICLIIMDDYQESINIRYES